MWDAKVVFDPNLTLLDLPQPHTALGLSTDGETASSSRSHFHYHVFTISGHLGVAHGSEGSPRDSLHESQLRNSSKRRRAQTDKQLQPWRP